MPINTDPNFWLSIGSGLLSGGTAPQQIGNMGQNLAQYNMTAQQKAQLEAEKAQQLAQQNKTLQFIQQQDPELGAAVAAGAMTGADAYNILVKRRTEAAAPKKPNLLTVGKQIYNADTREWIQPPPGMAGDSNEYGLQPVYGKDAQGRTVIIQLGKNGQPIQTPLPEGFQPMPGTGTIDQGTSTGVIDKRTGELIKSYPKNLADAEAEKTSGKLTGEARKALPATLAKANQAIATIDKALQHPGRETGTGLSSTLDPRNYIPGTDAANFQVVNKQLQGQVFLEAYQSLKGGGQITEVEGAKAEAAIARLSVAQSDEEYTRSLLELREGIFNGMARAAQMAGQDAQQNNEGTTSSGLKFKVLP